MRNCSCVTARCGIRYGLDVTVGAPMVNYRETIAKDLADFDYRPPRPASRGRASAPQRSPQRIGFARRGCMSAQGAFTQSVVLHSPTVHSASV
jgi:hypothetical protein